MLDGLCKHWGFYFTCGDRTLGSADFQDALRRIGDDSKFKLNISSLTEDHSNRSIIQHYICAALLARAILFGHFRTYAKSKSISEIDQKRIWVLLQAWPRPPLLSSDMFHELTNIILRAPSMFIFEELRKVWGRWDLGNVAPFLVLDEAQDAARMYTQAFLAKTGNIHRSALSALITTLDSALEALLPHKIITGTGLNLDQVRGEVRSGSGKIGEIEVVHDTGSFLTKEDQSAYIMQYLWPGTKEGELADDAKRLLRRAWRWLRGRCVRFVISLITC